MKKIKYILFLIIILGLILIVLSKFKGQNEKGATVEIDGHKFQSEIVETNETRTRGLGGRDNLCLNCAMLFIFPAKGDYGFWMKDMRFDLDIIWIADGKIVYIARNFSHESLDTINPKIPADRVLEINSRLSDQYGFKIGDEINIKL